MKFFFAFAIALTFGLPARAAENDKLDLDLLLSDMLPPSITKNEPDASPQYPLIGANDPTPPKSADPVSLPIPSPVESEKPLDPLFASPNDPEDKPAVVKQKIVEHVKPKCEGFYWDDEIGQLVDCERQRKTIVREKVVVIALPKREEKPVDPRYVSPYRSVDAAGFLLIGLRLGMTPEEAGQVMGAAGFSLARASREFDHPQLSTEYRRRCLAEGIYQTGAQRHCIIDKAMIPVTRMYFARDPKGLHPPMAKETVDIDFDTNQSGNRAVRIAYRARGDASLGTTADASYLRASRREAFFTRLAERYGDPDETTDDGRYVWGGLDGRPTMRAGIANSAQDVFITLEDNAAVSADHERLDVRSDEMRKQRMAREFTF